MLFAGLGLLLMARSGVVNIGAEGTMLMGALAGVIGSYLLGSEWAGLLVAALAGAAGGLVFAWFVVTLRSNQIVTGIAVNILALGLTSSLGRVVFGINIAPPQIASFRPYPVPGLSALPVLGPALFHQVAPVYIALLLVPAVHVLLYHTPPGLEIRAVGEHPRAADTVGVDVFRVRYATIVAGSALAGMGGAYMSLGLLSFFAENMVAGRGFIALAAVIFGRYTPFGTLGATLLFGAASAVEYGLQASGIALPEELVLSIPYVLTVAALAGLVGRSVGPAALGRPYAKE